MADPFIGEVKMFGFDFPPRDWATCDGQLLPINQNQALFSLLGTTYGGNGTTNFALPDLRGRTPLHFDNSYPLGQKAGTNTHTLSVAELPTHSHPVNGTSSSPDSSVPGSRTWAAGTGNAYGTSADVDMKADGVGLTGGGQPHENMPPFLTINFSIAIFGIFPSRN